MTKTRLALALPFALATLAGVAAAPASAQTVRWAAAGDALTMDPHSQNEGPTHVMNHQVYDSLVFRDQAMKLAPRLATSWRITDDPTVWEFKLREGVKAVKPDRQRLEVFRPGAREHRPPAAGRRRSR